MFGSEVPLYALLIPAFVSLMASAISYFFAKTKLFSFALLLFYTCNTIFSYLLLYNHHSILFYTIGTSFVAFPIICLIIFALDTHYALFSTDSSFVLVIVWLFIPTFFVINLIVYLVKIIHA